MKTYFPNNITYIPPNQFYLNSVIQVKLPLSTMDLAQTINEWRDVQSNKEDDQYLGDICFSVR